MKEFPIVHIPKASAEEPGAPGFSVPWSMAEQAYQTYTRLIGKVQTLERIAERGGFEWFEFVMLYCDQGVVWTEAKYIDRELLRHCTQRVTHDLVEYYRREAVTAKQRCREAAQTIIECIGSAGSENVGSAAERIVKEVEYLREVQAATE